MEIKKQCSVCEKPFFAANNKGKYCSAACRMMAYRKRNMKYAWQRDDLSKIEQVQKESDYYRKAYNWSQNKCKEYVLEITRLKTELNKMIQTNARLLNIDTAKLEASGL